jgi:cytochrome c553
VLSPTAQQGLLISPVPVSLGGLSGAEVEQVGEGSYLVNAVAGCGDCHDADGMSTSTTFLAGGTQFSVGGANSVSARNLTPDPTTGLGLTQAQFITAIRTGMDFKESPDGGSPEALLVMPWQTFRWMSTPDLEAIYAYLQAIPAVNNPIPPDTKPATPPVTFPTTYDEGAVTRPLPAETDAMGNPIPDPGFVGRGFAISPVAYSVAGLPVLSQGEFGRGSYLVNAVGGCSDCHTNPARGASGGITTAAYLSGGAVFAVPPPLQQPLGLVRSMSADLTGATNGSIATALIGYPQFVGILTQGIHVEDPMPGPVAYPMPWPHLKYLTADDMASIFTFLTNIPHPSGTNDKATQSAARYCAKDSDCRTGETCATATGECIGAPCMTAGDCDACQTCTTGACAAPAANAACLTSGL